jgi:hypothetical protein
MSAPGQWTLSPGLRRVPVVGPEGERGGGEIGRTGSKRRRDEKREDAADHKREDAERRKRENEERRAEITMAARAVIVIWELVWALIREHLLTGTGSGRLL